MISRANGREVFQVVAGFESRHYAVGDYCIFDKEDCEVLEIKKNRAYAGKSAAPSSLTLDYWGHDPQRKAKLMESDAQAASDDVDHLLYMAAPSFDPDNPEGSRVTAASHAVKVRMLETGEECILTAASDINKLELAYAMTVHKAQGSEWERVFVVLHKDHACMLSRELLYTAVTRAKKDLYVLCEKDTIIKACLNQEIKGETLEEKIRGLKLKLKIAEMRVQ
jgi:superfamily I DNA/RNA helicase